VPDFGIKKKGYRPLWQDTPGYKTLVDDKSTKGILPEQLESTNPDRGQGNLDSMWPVAPGEAREKERALPLPSNHDKKREKRIGPTVFNKPRKIPYRTLPAPGDEYGHPYKDDYGMPTRRVFPRPPQGQLAGGMEDDEEDPIDDQLEPVAGTTNKGPFPTVHQKNLTGPARMVNRRWYQRHKEPKKLEERMEYRLRGKRNPQKKLKRKYRRMYENRYKRRGTDSRTPAQKTKEWREEHRDAQSRTAGLEMLAEVMEMLGLDAMASNWPMDWNTTTKKTKPPGELDQNYGPGQSQDTGTPRKDDLKQKGQPLRAPDLDSHPQKGLKWELEPPASGGLDYPQVTTMNPTDGSGKVMPMEWYTDSVNNTQAIPDGRQDRYLHNNNFDVKQATAKFIRELTHPHSGVGVRAEFGTRTAMTMGEILKRCDKKIKERAKKRPPTLARTDTKNWIWHWNSGDHTVRVQAFKRGNASNFSKLNLRVSCSCPFWRWWGPEHWGTKSDYQKGELQGTASYPKIRDPARWRPVCKHAYAVLEKSQRFFVRPKKSPLRKLGGRFFVDSADAIEIEFVKDPIAARVARRHQERQISRRVAARYLAREES